jgi:hypothetical protein
MQTVFEQAGGPYTRIICEQSTSRARVRNETSFRVTYGQQVRDNLNYKQAAIELGAALLHQAACNGLVLDPEDL